MLVWLAGFTCAANYVPIRQLRPLWKVEHICAITSGGIESDSTGLFMVWQVAYKSTYDKIQNRIWAVRGHFPAKVGIAF